MFLDILNRTAGCLRRLYEQWIVVPQPVAACPVLSLS